MHFSEFRKLPEDEITSIAMIANVVRDMIFIFDRYGNVLFANEFAQKKLAYSLFELCHMNFSTLCAPEELENVSGLLQRKQVSPPGGSITLHNKTGHAFSAVINLFTCRHQKNNDILICICREISTPGTDYKDALKLKAV